MLTLYGESHLDSPFVFTAFVALAEKGVPFELRIVRLSRGEQRTPEFVERSLTARVPTLTDGDFSLSESLAIVEYLEETLPPPHARVLPVNLHERARSRQVLGWLRSDITALRAERPSSSLFLERADAPLGDRARADADKLVRIADTLLGEGRTTLFAEFCVADADLAFAVMRLVKNGDPVPRRLRDYAEAVWRRPSVAAWAGIERPAKNSVLGPF